MKLTFILTVIFGALSHARDVRLDRNYPWGSLHLSAATSETARRGETSLLVFRTDVLADFHFSDGQRVLLATGRLELDPATGDFTATDWPFYHGHQAAADLRVFAKSEIDSLQFRGGAVTRTGAFKTVIPEPSVARLRRKQLANLEDRR